MPVNHYERAFRAWPVLTGRDGQRSTITYGELGESLRIHHRPVRLVLAIIQDWCLREHRPPLTILVVSKDGKRPGEGFIAWDPGRLDEGYEEVYQFPWATLANPFQFAAHDDVTPAGLAREIIARPQDAAEVYQKVKSRGMAQVVFRLAPPESSPFQPPAQSAAVRTKSPATAGQLRTSTLRPSSTGKWSGSPPTSASGQMLRHLPTVKYADQTQVKRSPGNQVGRR